MTINPIFGELSRLTVDTEKLKRDALALAADLREWASECPPGDSVNGLHLTCEDQQEIADLLDNLVNAIVKKETDE